MGKSSGLTCDCCNDRINIGQEVCFVRVNRIMESNGSVLLYDQTDEAGDYSYPPLFLCNNCWDSECQSLMDTQNGVDVHKASPHLRQCDVCQSSILAGELIGLADSGELKPHIRQPVGVNQLALTFESYAAPFYICTACLNAFNVEVTEYWANDVNNGNECPDGLQERCWRTGDCQHVCKYEMAYQFVEEQQQKDPVAV